MVTKKNGKIITQPVLVMRSVVRDIITKNVGEYEYFVILNPLRKRCKIQVSKERAMVFIEKLGLVQVEKSKDGTIYDSPDRAFQRKWAGLASNRDTRLQLDKVWNF